MKQKEWLDPVVRVAVIVIAIDVDSFGNIIMAVAQVGTQKTGTFVWMAMRVRLDAVVMEDARHGIYPMERIAFEERIVYQATASRTTRVLTMVIVGYDQMELAVVTTASAHLPGVPQENVKPTKSPLGKAAMAMDNVSQIFAQVASVSKN